MQALANFSIGKTLYSDFADLASGRMNFAELLDSVPAQMYPIMYFMSDQRLKDNVQLIHPNFAGPGIHCYTFTWSPLALRLYPELASQQGLTRPGLLASEVAAVYPDSVVTDANGFCLITTDAARAQTDGAYARTANALIMLDALARRMSDMQNK